MPLSTSLWWHCGVKVSFLPPHRQCFIIILVAKAARKENCRIGKDKVNVLTVFHSTTNIPCWDFHREILVIIIESVSMKSFVFILATEDFPSVTQDKAWDSC